MEQPVEQYPQVVYFHSVTFLSAIVIGFLFLRPKIIVYSCAVGFTDYFCALKWCVSEGGAQPSCAKPLKPG